MTGKLPSIADLVKSRNDQAKGQLSEARKIIDHPVAKGDEGERIWIDILNRYLPERYCARSAFVIDSDSRYSDQIDVVIHDAFYTPFVFCFGGYEIVPAESVYAVFEVKQSVNQKHLDYASKKIESVRRLGRKYNSTKEVSEPKGNRIIGGLLSTTTDMSWRKSGRISSYLKDHSGGMLDIVCSADGLTIKNDEGDSIEEHLSSRLAYSRSASRT